MENTTLIKVSKEVADLLYVYSKLNNIKIQDFVNQVFEERFKDFKEKLNALNNFKIE